MPSDSNGSSWVLPAILLGVLIVVLVWCSCGSRSSANAVRLQKKNDGSAANFADNEPAPSEPAAAKEEKDGSKARREIRNQVLDAYLHNNSSGFARLGKKVDGKADQKEYYPQIHHYFRSNENSYESTVQKRQKKKKEEGMAGPAQAVQESEEQ